MSKVKTINHVAIVVEDIEAALGFWRDALGIEVTTVKNVASQQSRIAFLPLGESEIELVEPTTDDSGIAKYLKKRGPGMHHLCLEVDDIVEMLERLKAQGVELINPEPLTMEDGKKLAFIHPKSAFGVLVELYQLPK